MVERIALTPVSYVIFRDGESVLLQLRQGTGYLDGYWGTAAAGHVEALESAGTAAIREAHEELGITLDAEDLVALTVMHRAQRRGQLAQDRVDFFFICERWGGTPKIMEPDRAADLQWFPLDDLPEALVPHERFVLDRLRSGLPAIVSFGFATP